MPKMTGAQYLAEALKRYEVTHFFHVPAVLRRTLVEMEERTEITRVVTHGEKAAAYMADGYARATGKPGLCGAQIIGAMNLAAGLRDAWLARSPVIAMTGGRVAKTKFRGVYQEVDDVPSFESVTKFNATVDDVSRFPDMLRQAFRAATTGTPGPVHLQFAGNEGQLDQQEADMEMEIESAFARVSPFRPSAEPERIRQAAKLLGDAKKPVMVVGGGARSSGAAKEVVELAEKLNIPVVTSLNGKDSIPGRHPLAVGVVGTYSRKSANRVVQEADLVFYVGSFTGGMTTHFWQVPNLRTSAIQLDINPENIGRNYLPKVGICADARTGLRQLIEAADASTAASRKGWVERVQAIVREYYEEMAELRDSDAVPMRPERMCKELSEHLPSDAVVVVDTGHSGMWMGGMYDMKAGQSYMRSAGHLGWAFPAALGAKCGSPDRPVVCWTGDAGFWYHIGELETAARWNISAVILVNNNHAGNQSIRGFNNVYGGEQSPRGYELWGFNEVNLAKVAEAMGVMSIRVEKASELPGALDKAISANKPVVIDAVSEVNALAPLAVS